MWHDKWIRKLHDMAFILQGFTRKHLKVLAF
jgi:hypothetical protein